MAGGTFSRQSRMFPSQRRLEPAALVAIGQMLPSSLDSQKAECSVPREMLHFNATHRCTVSEDAARGSSGGSLPGIAVSDRATLGGLTQFLPGPGLSSIQIAEYRGDRVRHYEERRRVR